MGLLKSFASRPLETTGADIEARTAIVLESLRERTSLSALGRREGVPRTALRRWRGEFVAAGRERLAALQKAGQGIDPDDSGGSCES